MDTILEIIKYTVPALIVFLTVYTMMNGFMKNQLAIQSMKFKQDTMSDMLPLKLQAYERLALFAERISIPNLSYRLSKGSMEAHTLAGSMIMAIQQEYEHNLSQQIYVSEKLWDIVSLAKDQVQEIISQASANVGIEATSAQLIGEISSLMNDSSVNPILHIRKAIKKEMQIVL